MKLWLLEQNEVTSYDTYDSCVVVADTEEQARDMHPSPTYEDDRPIGLLSSGKDTDRTWATQIESVKATYLGEAEDGTRRVVCSSFNAG